MDFNTKNCCENRQQFKELDSICVFSFLFFKKEIPN